MYMIWLKMINKKLIYKFCLNIEEQALFWFFIFVFLISLLLVLLYLKLLTNKIEESLSQFEFEYKTGIILFLLSYKKICYKPILSKLSLYLDNI